MRNYCYICGKYGWHGPKCDPKRVKRHRADMEAANTRGGGPNPVNTRVEADDRRVNK